MSIVGLEGVMELILVGSFTPFAKISATNHYLLNFIWNSYQDTCGCLYRLVWEDNNQPH